MAEIFLVGQSIGSPDSCRSLHNNSCIGRIGRFPWPSPVNFLRSLVLEVDEASATLTLNRELLITQFELDR